MSEDEKFEEVGDASLDGSTNEGETLSFSEVIDFAVGEAEHGEEQFDGELPQHSGELVVREASDLLKTITQIDFTIADETKEDYSDEEISGSLSNDVVDLIMAIGAVKHEYDLDIEGAVQTRMTIIEARKNSETQQEFVDELMKDEKFEKMFREMQGDEMTEADERAFQ